MLLPKTNVQDLESGNNRFVSINSFLIEAMVMMILTHLGFPKKLWPGALALTLSGVFTLPAWAQSLNISGLSAETLIAQQIDLDEIQRQLEQNPQLIQQAQQLLRDNPELVQQTMQQLLKNNPNLLQDIQQKPELMQQVGRQTGGSTEINDFIRQNPDLYEQLKDSLPPQ